MRYAFDIPQFLDWVVTTWAPVGRLADKASYSRSHFSRSFSLVFGESARSLRRRLQLEAAAYLLHTKEYSVGEIAIEVGYSTPEAFTKSFRRAFGVSPKEYRLSPKQVHWLDSRSGIHFHPSGIIVRRKGAASMTFSQILFRHHADEVKDILIAMKSLSEEELDQPIVFQGDEVPFDPHDRTLRGLMGAVVYTQEVWMAAMKGRDCIPPPKKLTTEELLARHHDSSTELIAFLKEIEDTGLWSSEFVDALCSEPVRFRFDAVLAHIITFSAHRRQMALAALRKLGVDTMGYGDPIVWLNNAVSAS